MHPRLRAGAERTGRRALQGRAKGVLQLRAERVSEVDRGFVHEVAEQLDDSAPSIVLGAHDEQGNDLTEVNVTFDDVPLASVLDGKPIEVDSGEHVLRFERSGSPAIQQKLVLRAGEKARGVTVTLGSNAAPPASGPPTVDGTTIRSPDGSPPEPVLSPRHVTAVSFAVGALAAAGTGVYFIARSDQDRGTAANMRSGLATNSCTHSASATCQALSDTVDAQHREATVSGWLFAGAGALVAAAAVSWFVWPAPATTPLVRSAWMAPIPGGAAAGVGGSFR